jgi:putative transposase
MRHLVVLLIHLIVVLTQLLQPGGVRSLVAESLLLKHQLLIVNRSRQRWPHLSSWYRILAGWMALLIRPTRLLRSAIVLKPSTLLALHKAMSKRKYRMLFSPNRHRKPGPKGPRAELIHLVVDPVLTPVPAVGNHLELLLEKRMVWMCYSQTSNLNIAMRRS